MQDDIVCVTRHGRPLFCAMSEREVLNAIDASSSGETMTEEEVMQFVHDNRI